MKKIFIILLAPIIAFAQDNGSVGVHVDEDLFPMLLLTNARDQNYTGGLSFSYTSDSLNKRTFLLKPNDYLLRKLVKNHNLIIHSPGTISLAATVFTPDDLQSYSVIKNDRPYAFILFLSSKLGALSSDYKKYAQLEISLGMLGLNTGKIVQTAIHTSTNKHDSINPHTPRGWDHQISNGGEPTAMINFSQQSRVLPQVLRNSIGELSVGYKIMGGYYIGASENVMFRIGHLNPYFWNWHNIPQSSASSLQYVSLHIPEEIRGDISHEDEALHDIHQNTAPNIPQWEYFFCGKISLTQMLYNAMLNGQFMHSDHRWAISDISHALIEWNLGIGISYKKRENNYYKMLWLFNCGRTPEFISPLRRTHTWGSINFFIPVN